MESEVTIAVDSVTLCAHHWILDGKNTGVCNRCGAKKHFPVNWTTRSRPKAKKE